MWKRLLFFLCCFLLRASSSSVAEANTRHSAASSRQKHQITMDAFLGLGKRSPPVSSELLRSFFDVIPEPNKSASALKVLKAC